MQVAHTSKRKKIIASGVVLVLIIACGYVLYYFLNCAFNEGQLSVVDNIARNENVVLNLSSNETLTELRNMFPEKLNYTQLLFWESERLDYTENRIWHADPIDILNYQKGACGEFSILYVAICLANDVPARLVLPPYVIPNVVDHAWAEINPSNDGEAWIHVEVTDACYSIKTNHSLNPSTINNPLYYENSHYKMVLAFQITEDRSVIIIDRTSVYSPGQ